MAISEQQKSIIGSVDQIIDAKSADPDADTSALEKQIDNLVNQLYGIKQLDNAGGKLQ